MPSNQSPLGALPARFRRPRVLIVGCGDVGLRLARQLPGVRLLALTSSPERRAQLRAAGITPLLGDLDAPASLARLAGLAQRVVHLAPPASHTPEAEHLWRDARTLALAHTLRRRTAPAVCVYASTSGVYGDCAGQHVNESRAAAPGTPRAHRRVDAERISRHLGRSAGVRVSILRVPGIYAANRPGGTPRGRLEKGWPVLQSADDVYTNHIHADDLARALAAAVWRGRPQRIYNVCDDTELKMGDYYALAARLYGLPEPRRIPREQAQQELPLGLLSFIGESRRLSNNRLKRELRLALRYPTVETGLQAGQ